MSAEDLEIHQPGGTPMNKQHLHLQGSVSDGLNSLLQWGKGILRSGSLSSLKEVSSNPNEADGDDEREIDVIAHKEQERGLIKVLIEHN